MRVLITAGPHQGQLLDMGTAQAAAALRDGWAVVPLPEGEPMVAHHDQVIPLGFLPATAGAVEDLPRLEAEEEVVPITPGALAPAVARAIAGEPEPAASGEKRRKRG